MDTMENHLLHDQSMLTADAHALLLEKDRLKNKRNRTRFDKHTIQSLEEKFSQKPYPEPEEKRKIADSLKLDYRVVHKWFDNRRTKKRKSDGITGGPNLMEFMPKQKRLKAAFEENEVGFDDIELGFAVRNLGSTNVNTLKMEFIEKFKEILDTYEQRKRNSGMSDEKIEDFKREMQAVADQLQFEASINMFQGENDHKVVQSDIQLCSFNLFVQTPNATQATGINYMPPHDIYPYEANLHEVNAMLNSPKKYIQLRYAFEMRVLGDRIYQPNLILSRVVIHFEDPVTHVIHGLGFKVIWQDKVDQYSWGLNNLDKLRHHLRLVHISSAELMSIIVVATRCYTERWVPDCIKSLFQSEEPDVVFPHVDDVDSTEDDAVVDTSSTIAQSQAPGTTDL